MLTPLGMDVIEAGRGTIVGLESRIAEILGEDGHEQLREMLTKLLAEGGDLVHRPTSHKSIAR
jgi:hypothetical protein